MRLIPLHFQAHEIQFFVDQHGMTWLPAQGPCEVLGLSKHNISTLMRRLDADEKKRFNVSKGSPPVWCINESGLYNLILASRKPQAKAFKRWITHDVLPEIRKTGHYTLTEKDFLENQQRPIHLQHSKDVALYQSSFGGKGDVIRWYRKSSTAITEASPKDWVARGREAGLVVDPARKHARFRGREIVRQLQPAGACAMSLADQLVINGVQVLEAIEIGQMSKPVFQRILDTGKMRPPELDHSPLDSIAAAPRRRRQEDAPDA